VKARQACISDAPSIHRLVAHYSAQGLLLPRSEADIRSHIARFMVLEDESAEPGRPFDSAQGSEGRIVGCVALEPYGSDLAEIRSLAVDPEIRGRGLGARLVQLALAKARRQKIARVFAVTHLPEFFGRQGFAATTRWALPEKIARDCCTCPKAERCKLVAVVARISSERVAVPASRGLVPATKHAPAV
jgi:N-acetylglutamate synthase-like GNAT family acetyltransferase